VATVSQNPENAPDSPPADPQLAAVIQAWTNLPNALKAGIVAMVEASDGKR